MKRALAFFLSIVCTAAFAQGFIVSSPVDPYLVTEQPFIGEDVGFANAGGRQQFSSVVSGLGTTSAIIVVLGQSNTFGGSGSYNTVNSGAQNFSIYDGGIYACKNPALGGADGALPGVGNNSVVCQIADGLITAGTFSRVVMVPLGTYGASAHWAAGGVDNNRIVVTMRRLAALGLVPTYVLWHQGETDAGGGVTAAQYTANVQSAAQTFRDHGFTGPFFVALETMTGGVTNATIRAGQANAVSAPLHIVQGADWDTLGGANRSDGTHFSQTGSAAAAALDVAVVTNCKNTNC